MKKDQIKNSTDMFLYKSIIDLNTAKYLLEAFNDDKIEIDLETIFFHLQQCAEKSIKAILTHHNIQFNKTHDIEDLIETLRENNISTFNDINKLEKLTYYAVEGRYSIICDDISDTDIYIELLEKFVKITKKILGKSNEI